MIKPLDSSSAHLVVLCATGPMLALTLTGRDFKYSAGNPGGAQAPMKKIDGSGLRQQKNPGVTINHVAQPLQPQYHQTPGCCHL